MRDNKIGNECIRNSALLTLDGMECCIVFCTYLKCRWDQKEIVGKGISSFKMLQGPSKEENETFVLGMIMEQREPVAATEEALAWVLARSKRSMIEVKQVAKKYYDKLEGGKCFGIESLSPIEPRINVVQGKYPTGSVIAPMH